MRDPAAKRTVDWLCGIVDLMREPSNSMPVRPVLDLLGQAFSHTSRSWNWRESDGTFGMIMEPVDALLAERETLKHQLSIIYRLSGHMQYAFVIARGTQDFDDDDLEVAGYVQRSVRSLDQQCTALHHLTQAEGSLETGSDLGLSGRELAVLQLVADGHTTRMIARRLGCAPRTVEKHLERSYRKLGVRDRLNAVRVARLAGVLGVVPLQQDHTLGPLGPGEFRGPTRRPSHSVR